MGSSAAAGLWRRQGCGGGRGGGCRSDGGEVQRNVQLPRQLSEETRPWVIARPHCRQWGDCPCEQSPHTSLAPVGYLQATSESWVVFFQSAGLQRMMIILNLFSLKKPGLWPGSSDHLTGLELLEFPCEGQADAVISAYSQMQTLNPRCVALQTPTLSSFSRGPSGSPPSVN